MRVRAWMLAGIAAMAMQVTAASAAPTICPMILLPVCASNGAQTKTFPNKCQAVATGFHVVRPGNCDGSTPHILRVCARQYKPVCAEKDGNLRTFPNACEAASGDYAIVAEGSCEG